MKKILILLIVVIVGLSAWRYFAGTGLGRSTQVDVGRFLGKTKEETRQILTELSVDADGNVFIFPQLTVFGGGAVNVYTMSGNDTVIDLYWGLTRPVWKSGATVILRDAQENVRDTYVVP